MPMVGLEPKVHLEKPHRKELCTLSFQKVTPKVTPRINIFYIFFNFIFNPITLLSADYGIQYKIKHKKEGNKDQYDLHHLQVIIFVSIRKPMLLSYFLRFLFISLQNIRLYASYLFCKVSRGRAYSLQKSRNLVQ